MDEVYLEFIEIIDDMIRPSQQHGKRWFNCRIKTPSETLWIPAEQLPSTELLITYVHRLLTDNTTKPHYFSLRIFDLLGECKKAELDVLVKEFLTPRGLELPSPNKENILKHLKIVIKESSVDEQTLKSIRRCILIEKIINIRRALLMNLKKAEMQINVISDSRKPIKIVNDVDLEEFPSYLRYVNKYVPENGRASENHLNEVHVACECKDAKNCCLSSCSHFAEESFGRKSHHSTKSSDGTQPERVVPYDQIGRLVHNYLYPIFECNDACKCDDSCQRRVVQKGANIALEIFRTFNGCGWGVRTLEDIPKGTFVCRYAGEIMFWERGFERECQEYLFDIDYNINRRVGHSVYTVDAFKYGNISRFINHSCNSNLSIHVVFINNIHLEMAEIAFFAHRDIPANEELTINYERLVKKNNNGICRCPEHP